MYIFSWLGQKKNTTWKKYDIKRNCVWTCNLCNTIRKQIVFFLHAIRGFVNNIIAYGPTQFWSKDRDPFNSLAATMEKHIWYFIFLQLFGLVLSQGALPKLNIDRDYISVSGYSGGAFFAPQFHTAFSANISGSASWSGWPNLCIVRQDTFS